MKPETPLFGPEEDEKEDKRVSEGQADKLFDRVYGDDVKRGLKQADGSRKSIANQESGGTVPKKTPEANHIVNLSGAKTGAAGILGQLRNLKGAKEKGPVAFAGALIVLIITIVGITGSTSLLGQSITGNLLEKFNSGLSMFESANNSLVGPRLFGKGDSCATKKVICDMQGVSAEQMDQMKKNGVKFTPENGHALNDGSERFRFDSIEVDGKKITSSNIKKMLKNTKIKRALLPISKPTSWVAQKNFQRQKVKRFFGVTENPDTSAKDKAQLADKIYDQTHESVGEVGSDGKVTGAEPDNSDPDSGTRVTTDNYNLGATTLAEDAAKLEQRALAGQLRANTLATGDLITAIGQDGSSIADSQILLKQGWSWLNSVDVLDTACTAYQIGNAAAAIARTISMVNTIRYGYMFVAAWDKVKAGDSSQADIEELNNVVTSLNKYGESFDASGGMQYAFSGKLSTATPPSISTVGGETLQTMAAGFTKFNRFFDVLGGQKSALAGYRTVQTACGVFTNLAFQIAATIIDWGVTIVATPFTGGAALAGNIVGKGAIKTAFTAGKKTLIDLFKTRVVNLFKPGVTKLERQFARSEAKKELIRQATDPIQAVMIGLALVETFGLDYIAQSLAGTDVIAYLNDSVQTGDAIVASHAGVDTASVIAAGGTIQTIPQYETTRQANNNAVQNDIALQKEMADPLDINNKYSTLGSFVTAFAGQVGGINTSSFTSSLRDVLNVPLLSFSKISSSSANALSEEPTAQDLSDYVNDPILKELNISNDMMGNPGVAGNVEYLEKTDPMKLLGSAVDQGYIYSNGAVVDGSAYAKHVEDCNNPARIQVDPTLFTYDTGLQPESCRDGSELNNFFNAITTFLSILVDSSSLPVENNDKVALAKKIIAKGKVRYWSGNGGVHPTLEEIASGKIDGDSKCGLNINILKIIDAITDKYAMQINDINRRCEGSTPAGSAGTASRHYAGTGSAIDIQFYSAAESLGMAKIAMPIMSTAALSVSGFSQVGLGGGSCYISVPSKPAGVRQISDNCGSLHLDVPPQSDPNLDYTKGGI